MTRESAREGDLFDWQPEPKKPRYPEVPGHVAGNKTSEEAAKSMEPTAGSLRALIWSHTLNKGKGGATCDEVEVDLGMRHQTASARIRELVLSGDLIKTGEERPTRSNRGAAVYIAVRKEVT